MIDFEENKNGVTVDEEQLVVTIWMVNCISARDASVLTKKGAVNVTRMGVLISHVSG